MEIIHECNQLDCGGVEEVIRCLAKYDTENNHTIVAYKDGNMRKSLEDVGAKIIIPDMEGVNVKADVLHIHCGGHSSMMANELHAALPVLETIHNAVISPNADSIIRMRVGNSKKVSEMNRCKLIYNGIDFSALTPTREKDDIKREIGITNDKPVIGRLGRIGKDKCCEEWLLTAYELQKRGHDFNFVIVGGEARYNPNYIPQLKLMAASLPVKNCFFVGERFDKANYYQCFNYFLTPFTICEGFGLVFAEAMFFDLPIITYDTPVAREVVGEIGTFTKHEIGALADGIEETLGKKVSCRKYVMEKFSAETMTQEYMQAYKEIKSAAA